MLPRVAPVARADSYGVTGVAVAVPEHFLLPRPTSKASRAGSTCVRATRQGLGVVRAKTVISVILDGGTAQRRVGSCTAPAGSGQSGPSPSRMRPAGVRHVGKSGCMGGTQVGVSGWEERSKNWSITAGMHWLLWQLPAGDGARHRKRHPVVAKRESDRVPAPPQSAPGDKHAGSWWDQEQQWDIPTSQACQWPCWHPSLCTS